MPSHPSRVLDVDMARDTPTNDRVIERGLAVLPAVTPASPATMRRAALNLLNAGGPGADLDDAREIAGALGLLERGDRDRKPGVCRRCGRNLAANSDRSTHRISRANGICGNCAHAATT
jgi:hypothetical protein